MYAFQSMSSKKYGACDPTHQQGPYKTVHYDLDSDELTLELVRQPGTFAQMHQNLYFQDLLKTQTASKAKVADDDSEARKTERISINLNKQPKSCKDAINQSDASQWYESYRKKGKNHSRIAIQQMSFLVHQASRYCQVELAHQK